MRPSVIPTLIVWLLVGCARDDVGLELGDVHPGVFAMVSCWLSDTASPVVTEVNLEAVATNRNQFNASEIRHDGEWVRVDTQGGGFQRYRVLEVRQPRYRVEYQENGGGSLTTSMNIEIELGRRPVEIDGSPTRIRVMRVLSVSG